MNVQIRKRLLKVFVAALSAIIVAFFIVGFNGACIQGQYRHQIPLDDGWSVSFSGIRLPILKQISDFRIPSNINPGDTIVYERKMEGLPVSLPTAGQKLR